jgi:hypothetical protein
LHGDRSRIELDLRASLLSSGCQVLIEGSAIKNPRDWGVALNSDDLT